MRINVHDQAGLDAAIKAGDIADIVTPGQYRLTTRGTEAPRVCVRDNVDLLVKAYDSSQPVVWANGSSHPVVRAYDSSQPVVWAYGSSRPVVYAYDSSHPEVDANGSSYPEVWAYNSSHPVVKATGQCRLLVWGKVNVKTTTGVTVIIYGKGAEVSGGKQILGSTLTTPAAWCKAYGVKVVKGVATLYKAVDEDYSTDNARRRGIYYKPGTTPTAPDWDGGVEECGGGLHFSSSPQFALWFNPEAKHFLACPVNLKDIAVHPEGGCPEKVKARGCCGPVYEVDINGKGLRRS